MPVSTRTNIALRRAATRCHSVSSSQSPWNSRDEDIDASDDSLMPAVKKKMCHSYKKP